MRESRGGRGALRLHALSKATDSTAAFAQMAGADQSITVRTEQDTASTYGEETDSE